MRVLSGLCLIHSSLYVCIVYQLGGGACPATQDYKDAKDVCTQLGIGFEAVSFVRDYWTNVFMPTVEGYERCAVMSHT